MIKQRASTPGTEALVKNILKKNYSDANQSISELRKTGIPKGDGKIAAERAAKITVLADNIKQLVEEKHIKKKGTKSMNTLIRSLGSLLG